MPKLKNNILNLDQLLKKRYEIHMKNYCILFRDQSVNLINKMHMLNNRMFLLNLNIIKARCLKDSVEDEVWCWDMRFCHLNFKTFKVMKEWKIVKGICLINHHNPLCGTCLFNKHSRKSFSKKATIRAIKPLQLMNANICGPIKPPLFGKK